MKPTLPMQMLSRVPLLVEIPIKQMMTDGTQLSELLQEMIDRTSITHKGIAEKIEREQMLKTIKNV